MSEGKPVWLITGCSTGFGHELVKAALGDGFRVMATARNPDALAELAVGHGGQVLFAALDLTKPEQIQTVVHET